MPSFLLVNLTKLEKRKNKHVVLCYRWKTSDVRNKSIFSSFPLAHILGLKTFFPLHPCRLPGRQSERKNSLRKHRRQGLKEERQNLLSAHSDIFNQCFSRKHRRPFDLPSRMKSRTNTALISRLDFRCSLGPPCTAISSNRAYDFGDLRLTLSLEI